jgi:hypothetical protein
MAQPSQKGMIRRTVLLCLLAAIFGLLFTLVHTLYRVVHVLLPQKYAAWTAGDLLVEYMDTHEGKWPRGWKDLSEATNTLPAKGVPLLWNFGKLPEIVRIDWNVQPEILAKAALAGGTSRVKVVTQLDGAQLSAMSGHEPNSAIAAYLIKRYATNTAAKPASSP